MNDFIEQQILSCEKGHHEAAVDSARCMEVREVASGSTAAAAGIRRKDLLVTVDGIDAAATEADKGFGPASEHLYVFVSPGRQERITLRATAFPIGISLQPTKRAIYERFNPSEPDYGDLRLLWDAGAFDLLEELAAPLVEGKGGLLRSLISKGDRNSPALILLAAARCERGRMDAGMKMVDEYLEKYSHYWTQEFTALGVYYMGRRLEADGDTHEALEMYREAFRMNDSARIARAVEKLAGEVPVKTSRWEGQAFPKRYRLPTLAGAEQEAGLDSTLEKIQEGSLMTICLLATYRGNGPYNDFMGRYVNFRATTGGLLDQLHVLTMETERRADRPYWYEAEDRALHDGVPASVLLDGSGEVTLEIDPDGSPHVLLLDNTGRVLHEGWPDEISLWKCINAQTGAMTANSANLAGTTTTG